MKKPFYYALGAASYIVIIVFSINLMSTLLPEDNIIMPIVGLSLFVLSAAIMGFLFLSEPLRLYLDGNKKEAATFFSKIVGYFACFLGLFLILLFIV
jgi:hypothetical protein